MQLCTLTGPAAGNLEHCVWHTAHFYCSPRLLMQISADLSRDSWLYCWWLTVDICHASLFPLPFLLSRLERTIFSSLEIAESLSIQALEFRREALSWLHFLIMIKPNPMQVLGRQEKWWDLGKERVSCLRRQVKPVPTERQQSQHNQHFMERLPQQR